MQNISNRKKKQKKIFSKQNCRRRTERVVSQLDKLQGFHLKSEPPGWEQLLQQCLPEQNYRGHGFQDSGYSLPMSGQLLSATFLLLLKYMGFPGNPKISLLSLPLVRIEALVPFIHSVASISICIINVTFLNHCWAWSSNYM